MCAHSGLAAEIRISATFERALSFGGDAFGRGMAYRATMMILVRVIAFFTLLSSASLKSSPGFGGHLLGLATARYTTLSVGMVPIIDSG